MVREFARLFGLVVAIFAGLMFLLGLLAAGIDAFADEDPGFPGGSWVGLDSGWLWGTGALALVALAWFYVLRPKQ